MSGSAVSGSMDKLVQIWDAATGAEVRSFLDCDECGEPIFVCRRAFGEWCWKWSEVAVRWQVFTLRGHTGEMLSVAISPDGKLIVSGSGDSLVKIWDAATGAEVSSHGGCALCEAGVRFGLQWGKPRCWASTRSEYLMFCSCTRCGGTAWAKCHGQSATLLRFLPTGSAS